MNPSQTLGVTPNLGRTIGHALELIGVPAMQGRYRMLEPKICAISSRTILNGINNVWCCVWFANVGIILCWRLSFSQSATHEALRSRSVPLRYHSKRASVVYLQDVAMAPSCNCDNFYIRDNHIFFFYRRRVGEIHVCVASGAKGAANPSEASSGRGSKRCAPPL